MIIIDADVTNDLLKSNSISLDLERVKLNKEVNQYLILGLEWFLRSTDVNNLISEAKLIKIKSIDFNFADYQKEGFFFAMASWAAKYFGVEMPNYEVYFDSKQNKYIFPLLEGR